jgi:hypothetical protein
LILMITNLWLGKQTMQFTSEIFWGKQSVTCYSVLPSTWSGLFLQIQ